MPVENHTILRDIVNFLILPLIVKLIKHMLNSQHCGNTEGENLRANLLFFYPDFMG